MSAAELRAVAVLERLPGEPVEGAEVGVFDGRMSAILLRRPDLTLRMIDRWDAPTASYAASGDPRACLSREEMLSAMHAARDATAFARDRRSMHRTDSTVAAKMFTGLDFVFIDADHGYDAVAADIDAWRPTLKPGGLLCGHDYGDGRFGVTEAVDDAADLYGWRVDVGGDGTWFVWP